MTDKVGSRIEGREKGRALKNFIIKKKEQVDDKIKMDK